jgi:ferredoxin-NADP reductase
MAIQTFESTIKKIDKLSDNIRHYVVELDSEIEFSAGQFVNIEIEDNGEKFMRPYSIASSPNKKTELDFCIKLIKEGKVTPHLFNKKEGDKMLIKGAFGLFTLDKLQKDKIVMIATGTGIAP